MTQVPVWSCHLIYWDGKCRKKWWSGEGKGNKFALRYVDITVPAQGTHKWRWMPENYTNQLEAWKKCLLIWGHRPTGHHWLHEVFNRYCVRGRWPETEHRAHNLLPKRSPKRWEDSQETWCHWYQRRGNCAKDQLGAGMVPETVVIHLRSKSLHSKGDQKESIHILNHNTR